MTTLELGSVQKTMLLPLWGRAVETRKAHPLLVDRAAAEIIAAIDYDFSTIVRNISPITQLAWIARSLNVDRTIRQFLARDAGATIVNLGCGLDTTFERVDNGRLCWVDLDMPDVIELRKRFIPERARRRSIACSILDEAWLSQVETTGPVLFVAAGVVYYLQEAEVRTLFGKLADAFPGAEVFFEACSPRGLRVANKKVIEAGGMDQGANLKWALRRASELEAWDCRIAVVAEYPTFRNFKDGLSIRERLGTTICDALRIMSMVHLRLGREGDFGCHVST
jgi:O-methyltransferase involved in polyketide biosynthesis